MVKGCGCDCVGFVIAVLNELSGGGEIQRVDFPPDGAMHNPKGAARVVRAIRKQFPHVAVREPVVQPGDVIVVGPRGGGPGHAMFGGTQANTLWHSNGPHHGVQKTGIGEAQRNGMKVFRIYRPLKARWIS